MKETLQSILRTPQDKQAPALPAGVSAILVMVSMMASGILNPAEEPAQDLILVTYCMLNSLYLGHFHFVMIRSPRLGPFYIWGFIFGEVLVGATVAYLIPERSSVFLAGLMLLLSISISIISTRLPSYGIAAGFALSLTLINLIHKPGPDAWLNLIITFLMSGVAIETIHQLKHLTRRNINRLEVINEFSRQITSSLDSRQVLTLLNATVQNALEADTYMVGLLEDSVVMFELLYDDGEYFSNERVSLDGSIAGWVIKNQRELFLPDLRGNVRPPGVEVVVVGRPRVSLSWVGVPISGIYAKGIIAIASYQPNAFDRSDLELMNNMARHAALALDNSFHHAQVEEQSRLDSLTGVYNHGSFLKLLERRTEEAESLHTPLSLIMLDVDHFKQYNDKYGHRLGDEVLIAVCATIRRYIKHTDIVGRWGGEEFAIALPGATIQQAFEVAQRIHESILRLRIPEKDQEIPAPTLSQGIAQYAVEARDMMELIDLADRRLYIAKARGRNQIEPVLNTTPLAHGDRS